MEKGFDFLSISKYSLCEFVLYECLWIKNIEKRCSWTNTSVTNMGEGFRDDCLFRARVF